VAGSCEYGDEPSGSGATELVNSLPHTESHCPDIAAKRHTRSGVMFRLEVLIAWPVKILWLRRIYHEVITGDVMIIMVLSSL
jgi:hypothetical protein